MATPLPALLQSPDERATALALFDKLAETVDVNESQKRLLAEFHALWTGPPSTTGAWWR